MFFLRRSLKWQGRGRVGVAAGVALLVCVLAALGAGSAGALGKQCSGSSVQGLGAFLQDRAQAQWNGEGAFGFNGSEDPLACRGSQGSGGTPDVNYLPVASPAALHSWGADDGVFHDKERHFLGTDIAPSGPVGEGGSMLANLKKALNSDVVVVPVTQTSIAIAANPPALPAHAACTVPRISTVQLQKVFSGEIKNWRQLNAASDPALGGDCDQAMTRIVRGESAGTTYQFKHFLNTVNPSGLPCTGKSPRTWAQLQASFGGESPANTEWPRKADCQEGEGPVTTVSGPITEGEAGPLQYVAKNPGTITYGSLPEAEQWASKQIIDVHNGVKFADPATNEGEANCGAAKYTLPEGFEKGVNVDWSQVYGSDPKIGETAETAYPICTLTWDVVAADSVKVFGKGVATTLYDYLAFVLAKEGGQAGVRTFGYQDLPGAVAEAAAVAISHIDGEEGGEEEEGGGGGSGTVLCKVAPEPKAGVLDCPAGEGFAGKVTGGLMPETVATFESTAGPEGTITCDQAIYTGGFEEDGTSNPGVGITNFGFGKPEACTTTFPEEPEAVLFLENMNYDASKFVYLGSLAPEGAFVLAKSGGGQVLLRLESVEPCVYTPTFLSGQVVNGSPTRMLMQGSWQLAEGAKEVCPETLQQSSQLTVTRTEEGLPLYIAGE